MRLATAALLSALAVTALGSCGGGGGGSNNDFQEALRLAPTDTIYVEYLDVAAIFGNDELSDAEEAIPGFFDSAIDEFAIDLHRVRWLAGYSTDESSGMVIEAEVDDEALQELLEDDYDASDDDEGAAVIWEFDDLDEAVGFLPGNRYTFRFTADYSQRIARVAQGERDSLLDREDGLAALVEALPPGQLYYISLFCDELDGCEAHGESARLIAPGVLQVRAIVVFGDEDEADDAERDVEDFFESVLDDADNIEIEVDERFVTIDYEFDADDYIAFFGF
ncbi:MAG: hypothetical protein WEC33_08115 [Dehalococcoidia bacterium]